MLHQRVDGRWLKGRLKSPVRATGIVGGGSEPRWCVRRGSSSRRVGEMVASWRQLKHRRPGCRRVAWRRMGRTATGRAREMTTKARTRWVILRDLLIFQVKLILDGAKDLVFSPLAIVAAALDVLVPGSQPGHRFYAVLRVGEHFDRWLSLFGAADKATAYDDGLFGASRAGSRSLLGRLEEIVIGHEEPVSSPR